MSDTAQPAQGFRSWGLLELMGRTRIAGELSEQTIGGCAFIRVDVPAVGDIAEHTRYFTQQALYGMTLMAEATARKMAAYLQSRPVSLYEMNYAPTQPLLTGEKHAGKGWDDVPQDPDPDDDQRLF